MKKLLAFLLLPLLFMAGAAEAQLPPAPAPYASLGGQLVVPVTGTSSSPQALPASTAAFGALTIYNSGTADAYFALGGSGVVAVATGGTCAPPTSYTMCLVKVGTAMTVWANSNTYIAAITATGTASLLVNQASGPVNFTSVGGPAVTGSINAGTAPDVAYYAANGNAVSDGGAVVVTVGGLNVTQPLVSGNGLGLPGTNSLGIYTSGALRWSFSAGAGSLASASVTGPFISNTTPTCTAPVFRPNTAGANYGWSSDATPTKLCGVVNGADIIDITGNGVGVLPSPAVGQSALFLSGAIQTGGTGTTNLPHLFIQPTGTSAFASWTTAGTIIGGNFASSYTGDWMRYVLNNATQFVVSNTGAITSNGLTTANGNGIISSGSVRANANNAQFSLGTANDVIIARANAADVQWGVDSATPISQTQQIANVAAGNSSTAGVTWNFLGSASTGTALGGGLAFKVTPADSAHAVTGFTGSASPYTIAFTAGNISIYPIGTVMTVAGCTTATLNGTYTVTASSGGSVTATTTATGTGSPTSCTIVGTTSQNTQVTVLTLSANGFTDFTNNTVRLNSVNESLTSGFGVGWNSDVILCRSAASILVINTTSCGVGNGNLRVDGGVLVGGSVAGFAIGWTNANFLDASSTGTYAWTNGNNSGGTRDTGLSRISAGVIGAGNGTNGNLAGQFYGATLRVGQTTVAGLPAAATAGAGASAYVTDATACATLSGTVTGGGSTGCPVHSNGTSWLQG